MGLNFEWDDKKSKRNFKKHGVLFEEAATVFGDPLSITIPDPVHSISEHRFIIIGESFQRRILVVVHIERTEENPNYKRSSRNKAGKENI